MLKFIGGWGDRPEDLEGAADKVQRSWDSIPDDSSAYSPWGTERGTGASYECVPVTGKHAIKQAIEATTERVNAGPRTGPGLNVDFARTLRSSNNYAFRYRVRCGFLNPHGPMNHILMDLDPTADASADLDRRLHGYLTALVHVWEPDHISLCTYEFHKAQGHRTPQVRVGWLTYIRDGVALDLSALTHLRITRSDDGTYIRLAGTPDQPDLGQALEVRQALGYDA